MVGSTFSNLGSRWRWFRGTHWIEDRRVIEPAHTRRGEEPAVVLIETSQYSDRAPETGGMKYKCSTSLENQMLSCI
jgi:hypothetical protein